MITIFFSLLLFYNNAFSQYITKFDQWIFNFKQHRTLSILIGNDKEIFFQKTLPKQLQKPIRIFSLSKIIINLYIADLVNKNIITLDTPLSEIFTPYPEHWSKEITIKNLLEMNSGLRAPTVSDPNFGNGIIIGRYDKKYSSFLNQNLINSIQAFKPGFDFHYSIIDHLLLVEVINALNNSTNLNQKLKHFSSKLNLMNTRISYRSNEYGQYPFLKNILPNFSLGIQILKDDFIVWSSVEDLYSLAQLFLKNYQGKKTFLPLGWSKYSWTSSIPREKMIKESTKDNWHSFGALWWINSPNSINFKKPFNQLPEDLVLIKGHFGQTIAIIPSKNFVLIRLSEDRPNSLIDRQELILRALDI